jgi:hypothetical protein
LHDPVPTPYRTAAEALEALRLRPGRAEGKAVRAADKAVLALFVAVLLALWAGWPTWRAGLRRQNVEAHLLAEARRRRLH